MYAQHLDCPAAIFKLFNKKNPGWFAPPGTKSSQIRVKAYSPEAVATSKVTPGPMVELSAIFFM